MPFAELGDIGRRGESADGLDGLILVWGTCGITSGYSTVGVHVGPGSAP